MLLGEESRPGGLVTSYHHHALGRGGGFWARGCLRCCKQRRGAASTPPPPRGPPARGSGRYDQVPGAYSCQRNPHRKLERCKPNLPSEAFIGRPPRPVPPVHRETAAPPERKLSRLRKTSPGPNGATRTVTSLLAPELGSTVEKPKDVFM
jgi:hypothetical protein